MKKKILLVILPILLIVISPAAVFAETGADENVETSTLYYDNGTIHLVLIDDNAGLLSEDEITALYDKALEITDTYGMDIILLTVDDTNGRSSQEYADDYADVLLDEMGYSEDLFLYFIDMDNRTPYILTSGAAILVFDDYIIESLHDNSYDYLAGGEYYLAMVSVLDEASYWLRDYFDGSYYDPGYDFSDGDDYYPTYPGYTGSSGPSLTVGNAAAISVFIAFAAALAIVIYIHYRYKSVGVTSALPYNMKTSLNLHGSEDLLVNRHVTTRHIPKDPPPSDHHNSGGFSGGGSTHTSSGGNTFGGGGGRNF